MPGCCARSCCGDNKEEVFEPYETWEEQHDLFRHSFTQPGKGNTCCQRWKDVSCNICICLSFVVLVAAIIVRYLLGDLDRSYIAGTPVSTETCIDKDPLCWIKTKFGICDRLDTPCRRSCTSCTPYDEGQFYLKAIKWDEVENHMQYAKTGSQIPEDFHGIWWMDQFGAGLPLDGDPNYKFDFNGTNEILISYGDLETHWQPDTGCITPVPFYGGTGGHFTFFDNPYGKGQWREFLKCKLTLHFCFTNASKTELLLWQGVKYDSVEQNLMRKAIGYETLADGSELVPPWLLKFTMEKKPWGWDRVTYVLTDNTRNVLSPETVELLKQVLPQDEYDLVLSAQNVIHRVYRYPVLQIVDGNGKRTENYAKYLRFMAMSNTPGIVQLALRA